MRMEFREVLVIEGTSTPIRQDSGAFLALFREELGQADRYRKPSAVSVGSKPPSRQFSRTQKVLVLNVAKQDKKKDRERA